MAPASRWPFQPCLQADMDIMSLHNVLEKRPRPRLPADDVFEPTVLDGDGEVAALVGAPECSVRRVGPRQEGARPRRALLWLLI